MRIIISDIETEQLVGSKHIWLIGGIDVNTKERFCFKNITVDAKERERFLTWAGTVDQWVFHNGLHFDIPEINRLMGREVIDYRKTIDTLVVSRLIDYNIKGGHSLRAWGIRLGLHKGDFKEFGALTDKMIEYWENDLDVTLKLYNKFYSVISSEDWAKSLRCEHGIQWLCHNMHLNGFKFDKEQAQTYLKEIQGRMGTLDTEFQRCFPPVLKEVKRLKYRMYSKTGQPFNNVIEAKKNYPRTEILDDSLVCYDWVFFKPSSTRHRIERLWDSGWKPVEKTKTHMELERDMKFAGWNKNASFDWVSARERMEKFSYYGWKCSEDNLNTLPRTAPEGAHKLAEWLTLEGRRSSLVEWIGQVQEDGRVHGSFTHIGAWTGRLSHRDPNEANIPAPFRGEADTAVKKVKERYDGKLRALWVVPSGAFLVGTDADGIQLRLLAHFMESQEYVDAILSGNKDDETDIHNVNKRALGLNHITRDDAKTFILTIS